MTRQQKIDRLIDAIQASGFEIEFGSPSNGRIHGVITDDGEFIGSIELDLMSPEQRELLSAIFGD